MYSVLTSSIRTAFGQQMKTVMKRRDRKGSWFTEKLHEIKRLILDSRGKVSFNPTEEAISDLKYWKTKFRRIQRRSTKGFEKQKYKDIEKFSKESNKDRFWRKVRQAKTKTDEAEPLRISILLYLDLGSFLLTSM